MRCLQSAVISIHGIIKRLQRKQTPGTMKCFTMALERRKKSKENRRYENEEIQRLGSVVTNNGYSDWSSTDVDAKIKSVWFRFSRREDDFCR
ncbi:MAG: DUF1349 domain-containing protein [Butyrivibrio sp.]|nr:DUF1349 domain-containing protein [Butyrivibrio sp.]